MGSVNSALMTTSSIARRLAAVAAIAVLGVGPLAACSSDNVECTLNSCTVTFDRGATAESEVLGVDVKLVGVEGNNVKLEIAGTQVTVPVDGTIQAEGFNIGVQEVTADKVVVKIETA